MTGQAYGLLLLGAIFQQIKCTEYTKHKNKRYWFFTMLNLVTLLYPVYN